MHPYLRSFSTSPRRPVLLTGTVHHELLHHFLKGRVPARSALLSKYKNEPRRVQGHLHLVALQKAAYLKLGWGRKLQQIESNPVNDDVRRAWAIVKKEGHKVFVKELR